MRTRRGVSRLLAVVSYLETAITYYERAGRPAIARDYEDAYEIVAARIFGPPPELLYRRVVVCDVPCNQSNRVPKWKQDLLSRPLRRIVKVEVFRERDIEGRTERTIWRELLACGHVNEHQPFMPNEKRARHRRCQQCANQSRTVMGQMLQRKPAPLQPSSTSAASAGKSCSNARAAGA